MAQSWFDKKLLNALTVGAVGVVVFGVQPLLYGTYVHEGRISEGGLGVLAAIEVAAIAVSSGLGIMLLNRRSAWMTALLGAIIMAIGNALPHDVPLYVARACAGVGGGLLVAIAAQSIAGRKNVTAASGAFLFLQSLTQFVILEWFSAATGYPQSAQIEQILVALPLATLLLMPMLPRRLHVDQSTEAREPPGMPPLSGLSALLAAGLFQGSAVGLWAYLGLWLESRGLAAAAIAPALTASMIGQMAGALVSAAIAHRAHSTTQVVVAAAVMLGTVAGFVVFGGAGIAGWVLLVGFGISWMMATPALAGFVLEVDATRRSLPYVSTAQLLGAAVIPTMVGVFVAGRGMDGVMLTCGVATVVSIAAVVIAYGLRPGRTGRIRERQY